LIGLLRNTQRILDPLRQALLRPAADVQVHAPVYTPYPLVIPSLSPVPEPVVGLPKTYGRMSIYQAR
jgi:hypothetical protein